MKRSRILFLVLCMSWSVPASGRSPAPPATVEQKDETDYMQRGEDHFFAGRYGTALEWFRKALAINPDNARAHAYSGDILLSLGRPDEAIPHYIVAAELEAEPSTEFFRLGQIYYLKGDHDRAEPQFLRALSTNENLAEAHFYLALIAFRTRKNRAETLEHLKAFRQKRPDFAGTAAVDRAIAVLEDPSSPELPSRELLDVDPLRLFFKDQKNRETPGTDPGKPDTGESPTPAKTTGIEAGNRPEGAGQPEASEKNVQKKDPRTRPPTGPLEGVSFLPLEPHEPGTLDRAQALRRDDVDRALAVVSEARRTDDGNAELASLECEILFVDRKQPEQALPSCKAAAGLEPGFRNLHNLGLILFELKDFPGAFQAWRDALKQAFDVPLALRTVRLGTTIEGKRAETRGLLERMLTASPDHRDGLLLLLNMQATEQGPSGLRATAERLLALFPDDLDVLRQVTGAMLSTAATEEDAMPLLSRYVARAHDDIPAALSLASLHQKHASDRQALEVLQQLYADHPDNPEAVRAILIFFVHNNRNLDSAETVARAFLATTQDAALRDSILEILPEDLRKKVLPPPPERGPDGAEKPNPL